LRPRHPAVRVSLEPWPKEDTLFLWRRVADAPLGFDSKPPLGVFGRRLAEVAIEDQIEIVVVDEDPLEDVLVD
jgi:hypothetical protein